MYALVRYQEDSILFICKQSNIFTSNGTIKAKWINGKFYPANVLCIHTSKIILENLRGSLLSKPVVELEPPCSTNETLPLLATSKDTTNLLSNDDNNSTAFNLVTNLSNLTDSPVLVSSFNHSVQRNATYQESHIEVIASTSLNQITLEPVDDLIISNSNEIVHVSPVAITSENEEKLRNGEYIEHNYPLNDQSILEDNCVNVNRRLCFGDNDDCFDNLDGDPDYIYNKDVSNSSDSNSSDSNSQELFTENIDVRSRSIENVEVSSQCHTASSSNTTASKENFDRSCVILPNLHTSLVVDSPINISGVQVTYGKRTNRRYLCIYCKGLFAKLPQHLQLKHKDEPAVKKFLDLPPSCYERKKILETIRRQGDFLHNTSHELNSEHQRQKVIKLPSKEDIRALAAYVRSGRRAAYEALRNYKDGPFAVDAWTNLAMYTLISMLVFNRRRPGELERITLRDYQSLHAVDELTSGDNKLTQKEYDATKFYKRFEIRDDGSSASENEDLKVSNLSTEIDIHTCNSVSSTNSNLQDFVPSASNEVQSNGSTKKRRVNRNSGPKLPWSDEEQNHVREVFADCFINHKLPSLSRLATATENPLLNNRSPQSIKLWIANQLALIKNGGTKACIRSRWTKEMKTALYDAFGHHIAGNTLPCNTELRQAQVKYPLLRDKTIGALKISIKNERERIKRGKFI
ncbi:hypothetical protein RN001_002659 [Aquatica leii]|uniref:Uncharacterized protein n=1 Tax=Aquatica leii TaxID=1421715 RepID=A0AAN7PHI0_9COLE|nr:hypothetical protein RN001_002659 [Aquatica leii]